MAEELKKVTKEQAEAAFNQFIDESKFIFVFDEDKKSEEKGKK